MSFSSDLNQFNLKVAAKTRKVYRGTAIAILGSIIKRTPIDTGRLRANWQTDLNKPPEGEVEFVDPTGSDTLFDGTDIISRALLKDGIYIVNNLPYASEIENGSSKQAPSGMVKVTVTEFQRVIDQQNKKHKL